MIDPVILRALQAAGCTTDQIIAAVEADVALEQARKEKKRVGNRERQRRFREANNAHNALQGVTERDSALPSQDKSSPDTPSKTQPTDPPLYSPLTSKRGSRLPSDFVMPAEWKAWAKAERNWSDGEVDAEAASFVDHWHAKPGKDAAKLDWQATWRNWTRSSRRQPRANGPPSDLDVLMASVERKYSTPARV